MKKSNDASTQNIYCLDGRVPLLKAIPFGLQHVLAMFVANIAPIMIVAGVGNLTADQKAMLIQNVMFIAGLGTLVQLYPLWKVGAKLPIVMGISFTFVTILSYVTVTYGYAAAVGCTIVGGIIEGTLGLFAKYWRRIITPVVSACVVTTIGFSLLSVGATSFGGGSGAADFGSAQNLILGTVTLISCILFNIFAKSFFKQLSVLFGLVVGYVLAIFMDKVDFSALADTQIISVPRILPFMPEFNISAIIAVTVIFLVSATETIGDISALSISALKRDATDKEFSGGLACDGFLSSVSGLFGGMPITSFSQNVGLVAMTKVVNRFTIMMGALIMILCGLFPVVGGLFATLPEAVLGGCTIMMFGSIVVSGIQMIIRAGLTEKNTMIVVLSLSIGIGFTQVNGLFSIFPEMVQELLQSNCVAIAFVVALILNLVLPEHMGNKQKKEAIAAESEQETESEEKIATTK